MTVKKYKIAQSIIKPELVEKHGQTERTDIVCLTGQLHLPSVKSDDVYLVWVEQTYCSRHL